MRSRDRAAADQQVLDLLRHERPEGNIVPFALRQMLQDGACAIRIVDIDRVRAPGNEILKSSNKMSRN
jgi:hypothetical protein